MNTPIIKLVLFFLSFTATTTANANANTNASATANANANTNASAAANSNANANSNVTPIKPTNYLSTPHAKAVAGICTVIQSDTTLCRQTLKSVQTNDPIELIRAFTVASQNATKQSITFLNKTKPKYKSNAVATTVISSCESKMNDALEDFEDFFKAMGKNVTTLAYNYFTCRKELMSIMGYYSTCLDDIEDKNLLKEIENGIGIGKKLSSDSFDVFAYMNTVFKNFEIKVKLNEDDNSPRPPPLSDYYY